MSIKTPNFLRTEYAETPLGIDALPPRFSWNIDDEQVAYQISCASSPELLSEPDLWDSGRVEGPARTFIPYAGRELESGQRVYWRVRSWNSEGNSQDSEPTWFEMGLLRREDWKGEFLEVLCNGGGGRGYLSKEFPAGGSFDLWVQVDLGRKESFDRVVLWAIQCPEVGMETGGDGFAFPVRFRIEGADEAGFENPKILFETKEDVTNPGREPWELQLPAPVSHRFVRVTVLKSWLWVKPGDYPEWERNQSHLFGLDELQIFGGSENLALGKPVQAPNVVVSGIEIGAYDWHPDCLTDGIIHPHEVRRDAGTGNLLRRVFKLAKPMVRARAYIASKGFYELSINGTKVGDAVLDSAWTNYDKRLLYSTWDCGDLLSEGDNVVTILVGNGWTVSPAVILQLDVEHPDGSRSELHTDTSWRLLPSPVRENNLFHGEIYDAGMENSAVISADFNDHAYPLAKVMAGYSLALSAQMQPPIRVVETITPISLRQPQPGVWVFDMGRNFAGWASLRVPGGDRREIKLRFAETIFDDGTVWTDSKQAKSRNSGVWEDFRKRYILYRSPEEVIEEAKAATADGMINNTNYRVARATDRYLTSGTDEGTTWEPRFIYHGFRFVELTNYPGTPTLDTIRGRVVHTDMRSIGNFECSHPVLNWAWNAARRTLANNMHSVPTDCCQRDERQGWGADAHLATESVLVTYDAASTYRKWIQDGRDSQRADGALSDTAPRSLGQLGGDISWGSSSVLAAWYSYLYSGDLQILKDHFATMSAYSAFLGKKFPNDVIDSAQDYGDWLSVEKTPSLLVEYTHWYEGTRVTGLAAGALGLGEERARFEVLSQKIAESFHREMYDAEKGFYATGTQSAQAIPLRFGMVPPELRTSVFQKLVENIEQRGRHLTTGIVGTKSLLEVLCEYGREDLAFAIATTEEYPGWGFMQKHGATTIWEHWVHLTGQGMNSHNHPAFGSIAGWMMKYVAGIRPTPEAPGFRKVILSPVFPEGLDYAKGKMETPLGLIQTCWRREGAGVVFEADLPPGCTGVFQPPRSADGKWVIEGEETSSHPCVVTRQFRAILKLRP